MPDEVADNDNDADPADPHDQDAATPDSSPDWNVRQALDWIIRVRLPSAEWLGLLNTASNYDEATPAAKCLSR
jgi:hypothetical protein